MGLAFVAPHQHVHSVAVLRLSPRGRLHPLTALCGHGFASPGGPPCRTTADPNQSSVPSGRSQPVAVSQDRSARAPLDAEESADDTFQVDQEAMAAAPVHRELLNRGDCSPRVRGGCPPRPSSTDKICCRRIRAPSGSADNRNLGVGGAHGCFVARARAILILGRWRRHGA